MAAEVASSHQPNWPRKVVTVAGIARTTLVAAMAAHDMDSMVAMVAVIHKEKHNLASSVIYARRKGKPFSTNTRGLMPLSSGCHISRSPLQQRHTAYIQTRIWIPVRRTKLPMI